jgi:2-polyprenyl-3-methyl-5-hydroxy-6-metoxy-1,4-benzoquinol methylase/Zn ribbon nucleic-acid-binding protein
MSYHEPSGAAAMDLTSLQTISCPLCRDSESHSWGQENGFQAVKCDTCGLVYVSPRPALTEINEANILGQHKTSDGVLDVVFSRSPEKVVHYSKIIKVMFADRLQKPVSWLDVGAGFGEVVEAINTIAHEGSYVQGIEPMIAKAEVASRHGLSVHACMLSGVTETYDIISIINVFSHIPDFRSFLAEIKRRLNNGGELLIETGNGGDLIDASQYPDHLFLPDHLVFAGIKHMHQFLNEGGFEVVSMHQRRFDDRPFLAAKNLIKRILGRNVPFIVPYTSPFRTIFYRARLMA